MAVGDWMASSWKPRLVNAPEPTMLATMRAMLEERPSRAALCGVVEDATCAITVTAYERDLGVFRGLAPDTARMEPEAAWEHELP